ncbi:MAG TPA: hypothetical protein VMV35_11520 [Halothiobacillus sp.]|nr:hypothetical protein [Halothiobacillus sp.]
MKTNNKPHPATLWAVQAKFTPVQVDCTTAVVLKILDQKCKMTASEQAALVAIYDVVRVSPEELFDASVHRIIEAARLQPDATIRQTIHQLRVHAEKTIPKPIMKEFKTFLRGGLQA